MIPSRTYSIFSAFHLLVLFSRVDAFWDERNMLNPLSEGALGYSVCRMPSPALICDPDATMKDAERHELDRRLKLFINATADPDGETLCKRKGTTPTIAILDDLSPLMMDRSKMASFAVSLHNHWRPDPECAKSFLILLPTQNWSYISREYHYQAPVFYDEFNFFFNREFETFQKGDNFNALSNILDGLQNAIIAKNRLLHVNLLDQNAVSSSLYSLAAFQPHAHGGNFFTGIGQVICNGSAMFVLIAVSLMVCVLFEALKQLIDFVHRKYRKSNDYHPAKKEKYNGIPTTPSLPNTASPTSRRSPTNSARIVYVPNIEPIAQHANSIVKCDKNSNKNGNNETLAGNNTPVAVYHNSAYDAKDAKTNNNNNNDNNNSYFNEELSTVTAFNTIDMHRKWHNDDQPCPIVILPNQNYTVTARSSLRV